MSDAKITIGAVDNASRVLASVRSSMNDVGKSASRLGPLLSSLGVSLSAGATFAFVKGIVNGIDALNDLRDATGASIENISALEDVAARTGTSFDTVGAALVKFNGALNSANAGTDAARAFQALGLSVADLKAQDPAEALRKTAVALAKFADDGNKARLVQELFGKSLREVAPLLNDLATQSALVGKVTTEQALQAERLNQQLAALAKNSQDAARAIVSQYLPAMNAALQNFLAFKQNGLLGDVIKDAAKDLIGLGKLTSNAGADANRLLAERSALEERIAKQQALRLQTGFKGTDKVTENLRREIIEVEKLLEISRTRQVNAANQTIGEYSDAVSRKLQRGRKSLPASVAKGPKEAADRQSEAERYLETLQKQLEKTQELTVVEQLLIDIEKGRIKGLTPALQAQLEIAARQLDQKNLQIKAEKDLADAQEDRIKRGRQQAIDDGVDNAAYQDRLKALLAPTRSANLKAIEEDVKLLTEEYERFIRTLGEAGISEQQFTEAVHARVGVDLEKTKSLADELGLSFTSAFEDAVVGGKKFSDILKGLERDIIGIITRQYVTKPLADGIGKFIGGGDGGSGGGLGGLLGNVFNSIFGGFKAAGGPVVAGTPYIVGERGPEMFVPRSAGTIVPNGAGNVININVNQSFAAGTSRATTLQAAADARRQLELGGRNL